MHTVYFVSNAELTRVKIGKATRTASRVGALRHSAPDVLLLVGEIDGYTHVERWFHTRFAQDRLHGEWFFVSPKLAHAIRAIQQDGRGASATICPEALAKDSLPIDAKGGRLTLDIVEECRGRLEHGETFTSIARRFPRIGAFDLGRAAFGVTWRHLQPPTLRSNAQRMTKRLFAKRQYATLAK
jgi:hypothetical protein